MTITTLTSITLLFITAAASIVLSTLITMLAKPILLITAVITILNPTLWPSIPIAAALTLVSNLIVYITIELTS